jgi:hypothetical protein
MDRLFSLKFQFLFSVGNTGLHIKHFSRVCQMSEDKNRKLHKKLCPLISGRKAIFVRAWLTLARAVSVHCLVPLTNTFRAKAITIHNVKSSNGTMKAAFLRKTEILKETVSFQRKSTSVFGTALWKQCVYLEIVF